MKIGKICALALALTIPWVAPALAKSQAGKGSGAFCAQGGDNIHIPASAFSPSVRAKLRKGQRVKVNVSGFGPISCVVY
jgi:hypothetical protein